MTSCHHWKKRLTQGACAALLAWSAAGCGNIRLPERADAAIDERVDGGSDVPPEPDASTSPPIDAGPPADANLGCVEVDLGSEFGSPIYSGDNTDLPDRSASCEAETGYGDVFLLWTAPTTGRFRVDTCGSTFDTVLSAHLDGCNAAELTCSDDSTACGEDSLQSRILLDLDEGQRVVLIVDGFDEEGTFQVNIEPR